MNVFDIAIDEIDKNSFFFGIFSNMLKDFLSDFIGQKGFLSFVDQTKCNQTLMYDIFS